MTSRSGANARSAAVEDDVRHGDLEQLAAIKLKRRHIQTIKLNVVGPPSPLWHLLPPLDHCPLPRGPLSPADGL